MAEQPQQPQQPQPTQAQTHASLKKQKNTKFPVARIKKIMQMDDEVGKVAQATPVLISKALELFMQALVDETIKVTQQKGAKKMTAQHLKQSINETEQFDFLTEIAEKIPAPTEEPPKKRSRGARKSKTTQDNVKEEAEQVKEETDAPVKSEQETQDTNDTQDPAQE